MVTEYYDSVLEITVSFLGIHKREPDNYIGFLTALHLQCGFKAAAWDQLKSVFITLNYPSRKCLALPKQTT